MAVRTAPDIDDFLSDDEDEAVSTNTSALFEEEDADETSTRSSAVQAGWGAAKKAMENSSKGFTKDFRFGDEEQLVKFLDGEPMAVYDLHWINERAGRKSFVCLGSNCPLCRVAGHSPSKKIAFSILNFSTEKPEVQILTIGPRFAQQVVKYHEDKKTGPLNGPNYFSLASTGTGTKKTYQMGRVKPSDLAEDWEITEEFAANAVKQAAPLDPSKVIRTDSYDDLLEIAQEIAQA